MNELEPREGATGWDLTGWSMLRRPPTWFAASVYIAGFFLSITLIYLVVSAIWRLAVGAGDYDGAAGADHARNLLIAVGAVLAAPFVVWRTWIGHQQWRTSTLQTELQDETLNTSLISKAIELLGSMREVQVSRKGDDGAKVGEKSIERNIEARIGGLVLLRRIAGESVRYRDAILILMVEYIKAGTSNEFRRLERLLDEDSQGGNPFGGDSVEDFFEPSSPDVVLCVRYLLDLAESFEARAPQALDRVHLSNALISGINLSDRIITNIDFTGSYFINTNFSRSKIVNCIIPGNGLFGCDFFGSKFRSSVLNAWVGWEFDRIDLETEFPDNFERLFKEIPLFFDGSKGKIMYFRRKDAS